MNAAASLSPATRSPAPERPRTLRLRVREVAAVATAGVLVDVAVRAPGVGLGESLMIAVVAGGLLVSGRLLQGQALVMAASAIVFGTWATLRASPWLVPVDLLVAGLLVVTAVAFARQGDIADTSWPRLLTRGAWAGGEVLATAPYVIGVGVAKRRHDAHVAVGVARGLALAVPLIVLLGVLLASADAVFAHLVRLPARPGDLGGHVTLLGVGAWATVGFLGAASSAGPVERVAAVRRPLGGTEALVVLASMAGVFSVFAVSQVVALSRGGRHVIETAGLTYAEYARSGYFQLLAVGAITLTVLVALRAVADLETPRAQRWFVRLGATSVVLTVVVVVVALRRLDLYESAFGLTMLRLYGEVFAWWLATVFLLLGLSLTARGSLRRWFPFGSLAVGLAALFVLNVVNPEAVVVGRNIDHFARTGRFDAAYLGDLSADALPAIVSGLDRLGPEERAATLGVICRPTEGKGEGWSFNIARSRAERDRDRACAGG